MAIFSKRLLQEMLNQNAHFLSKDQLEEHVNRLNKGGKNSLSIEWEIVILNAFSKLGQVRYEQSFGGKGFPDLFFSSEDIPVISFVADIATVSDEGYEKDNPVRAFINEAFRILIKNNIKLGGFHYEIGDVKEKRGVKLKIPLKNNFDAFFKGSDFRNFITNIKGNPTSKHTLFLVSAETEVRFYYTPEGKYISGHHAAYKVAHSLTDNPVYYALKSKAQKLKKSGYNGTLAIFICDSGCNLLTSNLCDWRSYNLNNIVNEFFRQYSSISFILIFAIKETPYNFLQVRQKKFIDIKLFLNTATFKSSENFLDIKNRLFTYLPIPVNTAINAVTRVSKGFEKQGISFYGGSMIANKTIKISSRGLLELLSGRIEQNKFLQDHQFAPSPERPNNYNPFNLKLNEGRLVTNIRLEKSTIEDDDWIIFEFGEPNPAISKYRAISKKS
jgi:hypothetical protein